MLFLQDLYAAEAHEKNDQIDQDQDYGVYSVEDVFFLDSAFTVVEYHRNDIQKAEKSEHDGCGGHQKACQCHSEDLTVSEAVQDDNDQRTEDSVVQSEEYRQYTGGSRDQYFGCGLYPQGRL